MVGRNERRTEDLVRDHFKTDAYPRLTSEEQKSADPRITKCLAAASKHGSGIGKPEFLLHSPDAPGFLVVIECKADPAKHASTSLDQAKDFAVDGALHYAKHLSAAFDVIAIGVSGETLATMRVASFRRLKGASAAEDLRDENGLITTLLGFADYQRLRNFDPEVRKRTLGELMAFSRDLHNYMRAYAKVSEAEKPLLVSGILIALKDDSFGHTYRNYRSDVLPRELYAALTRQIEDADLPHAKRQVMLQPYSFLTTHPELSKIQQNATESPLQHLVADIDEHVRPFISTYVDVDVVGQFYGEFLHYTGGDKKGLGIVLTPRHVTDLFAKIANVGPDDTVLDTCSGTGGFLIAAMQEMDAKAGNDPAKLRRIRSQGLVGVEQNPTMFSLAASNMILRGDGKANLYQGSCFDPAITAAITIPSDRHPRPTVGLMNPPYSQKGISLHELDFIDHLLDCLTPGSLGVAIVPMSCAIDTKHPKRAEILRKHTLVAVMSMPDELFYPVGVVTCIMIFRAHQPHAFAPQATWFGYWKDDGFVKTRDRGRVDLNHDWPAIRDTWLDGFNNRRETPGISVLRRVGAEDEWCAEEYLLTNIAAMTRGQVVDVVRNFAIYEMMNGSRASVEDPEPFAETSTWREFRYEDLFDIVTGDQAVNREVASGEVPFVRATMTNNGVVGRVDLPAKHPAGCITVPHTGNGTGEAFYQPEAFFASHHVQVLYPKERLSSAAALFVCAVIRAEKFRFSWGRAWTGDRMRRSIIKLPAAADGRPDWQAMERTINSLPYSDTLARGAA